MKKHLTIAALLLLALPVVTPAQEDWTEKRHTFNITAGFLPFTQDWESYDWFPHDHDWWWPEWGIHDIYNHYGHNDAVYKGPQRISGAIGITYGYQVKKWLRVQVTATHAGVYRKLYKYSDGSQYKNIARHYLYFMPGITFTYLNRPMVRLYSGANLGVGGIITKDDEWDTDKVFFGGQVTFFGIEVGRKWYGMAEVGAGMKGIFVGGFGYRF